jgi:hypothetical protein
VVVGTLILLRIVIDERKPIAVPVTLAVISGLYVVKCDYISGNNALTARW